MEINEIEQELKEEASKYNSYSTSNKTMKVVIKDDFASLYLDNELITEDLDFLVLERIKQINYEEGLNYF